MTVLSRRSFLVSGTAAVLAGCSSAPPPAEEVKPEQVLSDADRERIAMESELRRRHLLMLEEYKVSPIGQRTTPPTTDIVKAIRELDTQLRMTFRLHPRFGPEPPADATKLGGRFLWPEHVEWPACPDTHLPYAAVLQLRQQDSPNRVPFQPGTNLLQIFWKPRDPVNGEMAVKLVWRSRASVEISKVKEKQSFESSYPSLVPVPCLTFPEPVRELPDWDTLAAIDPGLRAKLQAWIPPDGSDAKQFYNRNMTYARGTKAGGWSRNPNGVPQCKVCRKPMTYFLTIDTAEWTPPEASRWRPLEDADDAPGRRAASGLHIAGGLAVEFSYCNKCENYPVRAMVVG